MRTTKFIVSSSIIVILLILCFVITGCIEKKPVDNNPVNSTQESSNVTDVDNLELLEEKNASVSYEEENVNIYENSENKNGVGFDSQEESIGIMDNSKKETNTSVGSSTNSSPPINTEPSAAFLESLGLTLEESKALVEAAKTCILCGQPSNLCHLYGRDMNCYDCGEPCKANTCHICDE